MWQWVSDRAILWESENPDLAAANAAARRLAQRVTLLGGADVEDLVPAARSLLVILRSGAEPSAALLNALNTPTDSTVGAGEETGRLHEIPVRYGGSDGRDLADVARHHGLTEAEVIRRHSAVTYTVGFLGFAPGFPYLIGLPADLATPRLATPRTRVPPGSVGIGDVFTGIYPHATPGGWRLIGRTEVMLFDVDRDPPALCAPGDQVRLVPR